MRQKGFTLLEVLIALAILAMAFVALFTTMTQITSNQLHIMDKTFGVWVADNVLTMASSGMLPDLEQNNTLSGESIMGFETYSWTLTKKTTEDNYVNEIEIIVRDKLGNVMSQLTGYKTRVPERP